MRKKYKWTAREKEKQGIIKGIAAYKPMQDEIIEAIRKNGGKLDEDEFDREFATTRVVEENGVKKGVVRPLSACGPMTGSTILLGGINGDYSQQQYLHLAQMMMAIGILDAKTVDDQVVYTERVASQS